MRAGRLIRSMSLVAFAGVAAMMPAGAQGDTQPSQEASERVVSGPVGGEMRDAGQRIRLDSIPTMIVTSTGNVIHVDPSSTAGTTPQFTSTHTNADFGGGNYIAQGGFAEGEYAGATYNIPNSLFPIRIDYTEMIFATSGANQPTTTEWGIEIYDGEPTGGQGTLVASYDSVNDFLPQIQLPGGTNGVNVLFQVDPSDPQQVIIPKNPNLGPNDDHKVTIAYGVIEHNNQTGNPCFTAPLSCCNAFPVSDIGGLAAPSLNWIDSLPCSSIICPSGGWFRFGQINQLCRPSGDWVMRMTWSSLTVPCIGDANGSGTVNIDDLNMVLASWFTPQVTGTNGDVTSNGFVNIDDLNLVLANWGNVCQ